MRKEPNYLYLVISLLIAVVLITSAPPLKPLGILGVFTGALSLMATAYIVTERRLHVLLAAVLGAAALLPFAWFSIHPGDQGRRRRRVIPLVLCRRHQGKAGVLFPGRSARLLSQARSSRS